VLTSNVSAENVAQTAKF